MPVNRLKLLAFAFGAAIAGLTGTIFAPLQVGVFPANFDLALLITVYAMVILGGAAASPASRSARSSITVSLEVLHDARRTRAGLLRRRARRVLVVRCGHWWRLAVVLAGTVAVRLRRCARSPSAVWERGTRRRVAEGAAASTRLVDGWVLAAVEPADDRQRRVRRRSSSACSALTLLRGLVRLVALVPRALPGRLRLGERLSPKPSVTRYCCSARCSSR